MDHRKSLASTVVTAVGVLAACAQGAAEHPAPVAKEQIAPAVCLVAVRNSWGIPQSFSTGFLLGDGRFAVCDLGSVRQRSAARVILRFSDGAQTACTQFGMASPALGLVLLKVGESDTTRAGLPLVSDQKPFDAGIPATTAGWRWGDLLAITQGRALAGPKADDVASRCRVKPPEGIDSFLRIEGGRIEGASGSPVLDGEGAVLAVRLDVAAKGLSLALAVPAAQLRQSLLSAQPELKPLSELPEPLWPVSVVRLPGEPVDEKVFARATQVAQQSVICEACGGKGRAGAGAWFVGSDRFPCRTCGGTGLHLSVAAYGRLAEWALQGTRIVWGPAVAAQTRAAVRKTAIETISRLAKMGQNLRWFGRGEGAPDIPQLLASPRTYAGTFVLAQVEEQVEGPDGQYLILRVANTRTRLAVRTDDLTGTESAGPMPGRNVPVQGGWLALAGTVLSQFDSNQHQGLAILPFEWMPFTPPADDRRMRGQRDEPPDEPPGRGPDRVPDIPRGGWGGGIGRGMGRGGF